MKKKAKNRPGKILLIGIGLIFGLFAGVSVAQDLMAVYRDAAIEDPQLEQAREAIAAVLETQVQANAALYLPEANFSANVNGDSQLVRLSRDSTGASGRSNFMAGGYVLSLTQPILHYDRVIGLQQSDSRVAQANAEYASAEIALLLRVAERYFEVLAANENLKFAKLQQESLARSVQETKLHEAAGYLARTDVEESQAGADRATADAVDAEHQLKDALEGLQEVTGTRYETLAALNASIPLVEPDPPKENDWVNKALAQNLGLLATGYTLEAAKIEIKRQEAAHFPTLDAIGNHSFSTSGGRFGNADIEDTLVGLTLNVPLYQGGRTNSKIREAEHRYREALAKFKQQQRSVHRSTSKAFLGVTAGISRVKAFEQTLLSSKAATEATKSGFQVGRRTALDVIISEREQFRAQRDYAKSRYDYLLNTLRLKQSVGTLSPTDLATINQWLEH